MKKTKRMLAILLALVICLSLAVIPAGAAALTDYTADGTMTELASGTKTEKGVYSISSADELKALATWVNAGYGKDGRGEGFTFFLTSDIKAVLHFFLRSRDPPFLHEKGIPFPGNLLFLVEPMGEGGFRPEDRHFRVVPTFT